MANQEQNPPQHEQPFVVAKQVGFNLEDIILNPYNEVALLYPEHNNKDDFKSKALENSKVYFSTPTGGIYVKIGVHTFRNSIGAHYLPHSSEYVAPPSIDIVRPWFETIRYGEAVPAKWTLKKSLLPPRWSLANRINIDYASIFWEDIIKKLNKKHREKVVPYTRFLSLLMMHKMKEGYRDGELTIYPIQQRGKKGGSSKAPIGSKTIHSKKRKESSSAMDSNPSQPPVSTPVMEGTKRYFHMITYLPLVTIPHVLADQTKFVEGLETVLTQPITGKRASSVTRQIKEETSNSIKLEDLAKLVSHVQPRFKDLDSPEDDPIIVVDDTDEDEEDEIHAATNDETKDTSVPKSSSQSSQIQELTNQVIFLQSQKHKLELEKNKLEAEAALLKAQPSFPNMEQLNELLINP
ncbi:hypothetical protein Tco_0206511 [Tanacetum coccineum]